MTGLKRHELSIRVLMMLIGATLCGFAAAGALHWIEISRTENLILGTGIFVFIVLGYFTSHWLRMPAKV